MYLILMIFVVVSVIGWSASALLLMKPYTPLTDEAARDAIKSGKTVCFVCKKRAVRAVKTNQRHIYVCEDVEHFQFAINMAGGKFE